MQYVELRKARPQPKCKNNTQPYDLWKREWRCENLEAMPLGGPKGVAKHTCGLRGFRETKSSVVVYSVERPVDLAWENGLQQQWPEAELHVLAPAADTGAWIWLNATTLDLEGLNRSVQESVWSRLPPFSPAALTDHVSRRLQALPPRTVTLLNADVAGPVWGLLEAFLLKCTSAFFQHLNLNLHGTECSAYKRLFDLLDRCGYLIAFKDSMTQSCSGHTCVGYTLVSRAHALEDFTTAHPCPQAASGLASKMARALKPFTVQPPLNGTVCLKRTAPVCGKTYPYVPSSKEMQRLGLPLGCPIKVFKDNVPTLGFGNRLGVLLLFAVVGEILQRPLIVHWTHNPNHLGARFLTRSPSHGGLAHVFRSVFVSMCVLLSAF